jgi:hypothetical protein
LFCFPLCGFGTSEIFEGKVWWGSQRSAYPINFARTFEQNQTWSRYYFQFWNEYQRCNFNFEFCKRQIDLKCTSSKQNSSFSLG